MDIQINRIAILYVVTLACSALCCSDSRHLLVNAFQLTCAVVSEILELEKVASTPHIFSIAAFCGFGCSCFTENLVLLVLKKLSSYS